MSWNESIKFTSAWYLSQSSYVAKRSSIFSQATLLFGEKWQLPELVKRPLVWSLQADSNLIGCLLASRSSLFPAVGGGGAAASMVEQHVGLIGLELVLWDRSHTAVVETESQHREMNSWVMSDIHRSGWGCGGGGYWGRVRLTWSRCRSTTRFHPSSRLCSGPCWRSQCGYILHINHRGWALWSWTDNKTIRLQSICHVTVTKKKKSEKCLEIHE